MGDHFASLAYLVLLLIAVGGFLLVELRERPGKTLRMAAAWGMIFLGAIALSGLWPDIRNAIAPEARMLEGGRINKDAKVTFTRKADAVGHVDSDHGVFGVE